MTDRRLKVSLATPERQEACAETLRMCAQIARDLADNEAKNVSGPIALLALAGIFDDLLEQMAAG